MAKESGIQLSAREQKELHQLLKQRTEAGVALRSAAILLSGAGLSAEDVGAILGTTSREVRRCRKRWRAQGIFGLRDQPRSGRPHQADASYIRLLIRTAQRDPRKLGYAFSRWTTPRLSTYLLQKTGIRLSPDHVGKLLRDHNFAWGKSKRTTMNLVDPVEKKTCREMAKKAAKGFEILSIRF